MLSFNAVQTKLSSTKSAVRGKLCNKRRNNTSTNYLHRLSNRKIDVNSVRWWPMRRESWTIKTFKDTRIWIHRRVMEASWTQGCRRHRANSLIRDRWWQEHCEQRRRWTRWVTDPRCRTSTTVSDLDDSSTQEWMEGLRRQSRRWMLVLT